MLIKRVLFFIFKLRIYVPIIFFMLAVFMLEGYMNGSRENIHGWVLLAFAIWIQALYLIDRVFDREKDILTDVNEVFTERLIHFLKPFSVFLVIVPLIILWIKEFDIIPYIPFIPLAFLYTIPIFQKKRIKNFIIIKNLFSAIFIWSLPLLTILYFYHSTNASFNILIQNISLFGLYVFLGEIVWDIKDITSDTINKVNTLPVKYGLQQTKIICLCILIIIILLNAKLGNINYVVSIGFGLFIAFVNEKTPTWVYNSIVLIISIFFIYRFFYFLF